MHNKKVLDEFLQSELTHVTSTQVEKGNISRTPKPSLVSPSHQQTPPPGNTLTSSSTDCLPGFVLYIDGIIHCFLTSVFTQDYVCESSVSWPVVILPSFSLLCGNLRVNRTQFTISTVDGHLSSLQSWVITNHIAMNVPVHVIWKTNACTSVEYKTKSGIPGSQDMQMFSLVVTVICFSKVAVPQLPLE